MLVRRAALALVAVGFLAVPAAAQYPPSTGVGTVSSNVVEQGSSVLFSGDGFAPGSDVAITDNNNAATLAAGSFGVARAGINARPVLRLLGAPANDAGTFSVRVLFANNAPLGPHLLQGTGTDANGNTRIVSATVTVVPRSSGGGLPSTGSGSTLPGVAIGLGLVAAGAVAVYAGQRVRTARRATA